MKKIAATALMALAIGGAHAQAYIGGNFGSAKIATDCPAGASCDDTAVGYKVYLGYADPASPHFSVETGYIDFGKSKASIGALSGDIKSHAYFLTAGWHGNFTPQFGGGGRLGFANVQTKCSVSSAGLTGAESDISINAIIGLDLTYSFSKNLKAVLAADLSRGECDSDSGSVSLLSIGAQYIF